MSDVDTDRLRLSINVDKFKEIEKEIQQYIDDERKRIDLVRSVIGLLSEGDTEVILEKYLIKIHDNLIPEKEE